ncbi:hypothetical protein [Mycobacterium servetii]|uniref:Uncharacterized protein n=1 Tax=Mycobacterium servetii TaxID=3237418 RepID=A0ABV4BZL0_9MYCO
MSGIRSVVSGALLGCAGASPRFWTARAPKLHLVQDPAAVALLVGMLLD